jgi:hypothetical protein
MRKRGIAGLDYLLQSEKAAIAGVAQDKINLGGSTLQNFLKGNKNDALGLRNISVPSLLKTYCNMIELHRLRSEIILASAEC